MASNTSLGRAGPLGFTLPAHIARYRISALLQAVFAATRRSPAAKKEPFYPPRRTAFVEDAAMAREMYRL